MITSERLKKDQREAFRYKRRLREKGKDGKAFRMGKKAINLTHHIRELQTIGGYIIRGSPGNTRANPQL